MRRVSEVRAEGTAEWLEFVRQEYPLAEVTRVRDLGGNYNLNLQVSTTEALWSSGSHQSGSRRTGWPQYRQCVGISAAWAGRFPRRSALGRAGDSLNCTAASWRSSSTSNQSARA